MRRKIIKQGHNTLTITLPAEWTKRFNLDAGKEVELIERDNGLFLSTEKNGEGKKIELCINSMDIPTIWKYLMSVYREGYDEVVVKFDPNMVLENPYKFFAHNKFDAKYSKELETKPIVEIMQGFVNRFIGFEIIDHGKDYVVIKDLSAPSSKEFDNSLRRVFLLVQQMAEEACESIKKGDYKPLLHTHDIDVNLDKFQDYCIRILNKLGSKETRKTSLLFSILYFLELIGDEYKNISHHLIYDFPNKKSKAIEGIALSIKEQLDIYYDLFYKFDLKKIKRLSEIDQSRYFSVDQTHRKVRDTEIEEIFHHLRSIAKHINSLTELRIEMEF